MLNIREIGIPYLIHKEGFDLMEDTPTLIYWCNQKIIDLLESMDALLLMVFVFACLERNQILINILEVH